MPAGTATPRRWTQREQPALDQPTVRLVINYGPTSRVMKSRARCQARSRHQRAAEQPGQIGDQPQDRQQSGQAPGGGGGGGEDARHNSIIAGQGRSGASRRSPPASSIDPMEAVKAEAVAARDEYRGEQDTQIAQESTRDQGRPEHSARNWRSCEGALERQHDPESGTPQRPTSATAFHADSRHNGAPRREPELARMRAPAQQPATGTRRDRRSGPAAKVPPPTRPGRPGRTRPSATSGGGATFSGFGRAPQDLSMTARSRASAHRAIAGRSGSRGCATRTPRPRPCRAATRREVKAHIGVSCRRRRARRSTPVMRDRGRRPVIVIATGSDRRLLISTCGHRWLHPHLLQSAPIARRYRADPWHNS